MDNTQGKSRFEKQNLAKLLLLLLLKYTEREEIHIQKTNNLHAHGSERIHHEVVTLFSALRANTTIKGASRPV